jgi:RimJ/RimL family protein N-acetyltransferase
MALEGESVRLRAIEPEDVDQYVAWLNDPEVTRTISQRYPLGREAERAIVERLGRAQRFEHVVFAIELRETGEHVGTVDLHNVRYENRGADLGLFIGAREHWGRGYAHDAMRTVLRFAFWEMNLRYVWLEVIDDNPRARALYERLGFVHEGTSRRATFRRGRELDMFDMSITREEFEALHGTPPDLRTEPLP